MSKNQSKPELGAKTDLIAMEERVRGDRDRLATSVVRVRILAAGLALLGAGCAVLVWGPRQTLASGAVHGPATEIAAFMPPFAPTASALGQALPQEAGNARGRARALFAGLPLIFEPNRGQGHLDPADPRVAFLAHGSGYSLFLGSEGAILSLSSSPSRKPDSPSHEASAAAHLSAFEMKLAGANANPRLLAADVLPGRSNYLLGNDPAKWLRGVPQFARVRYENVYPGIDLVFYGNQGRLEYDFQVAAGADPARAELEFKGAKKLELEAGALVIKGDGESVRLEAPRVYQEVAGRQEAVAGNFVLRSANRVGFAIGSYDHSRTLVIDPILSFSTFFGGSGNEQSTSVAVDGAFNIYLTGSTNSTDLLTLHNAPIDVFQTTLKGTQNVYVAKITPPLGALPAALDYVTYLGGSGEDTPAGISVDGSGDAFVAGTTSSPNFPTVATTAYQSVPEPGSKGATHVFVTELNSGPNPAAASELLYSSYLSGNNTDQASGMTIDASGNVYVTGITFSTDVATTEVQFPASTLPQVLAFQTAPRGPIQFFVTKVNTNSALAGSIAYSTYFGGGVFEGASPIVNGGGIAVDTNGNVYFTGTTNFLFKGCAGCGTTDFPILNPYQPCLDQPPPAVITNPPSCTYTTTPSAPDAFVTKLNPNASQGEQLIWSTYLGGTGIDSGSGIGLDSGAANVYVVGTTNSTDIGSSVTTQATSAPYQRCLDQGVNPPAGTMCAPPASPPNDAFVARLTNPAISTTTTTQNNVALNYFSYLGGSGPEAGLAITVDSAAGALVTGWTQSPDFPIFPKANPIQSTLNGMQDAFVARLNTAAVVGQATTASWADYFGGSTTSGGAAAATEGTGIALDVNQNTYFAGDTNAVAPNFPTATPLQANNNGGSDAFVTQLGTAVSLSIQGTLTLGTNQIFISAGNPATFTYTVTNNGPDLASNITVTDNLTQAVTSVPLTFVSASTSAGTCGGQSTNGIVSCSLPSLQAGSTATITIVVTPTPNPSGTQATFNGGSVQVMSLGNIVRAQALVPATMSDFNIQVNPTNRSVAAAGDTATYQVQLRPQPVYGTPIALSCTGLPTAATCAFTNSPVTLVGPGSSTLNVTTTSRPLITAAIPGARQFYAIWLVVPGLALLGMGAGSGSRRRRRIAGLFLVCLLFALTSMLPSCSHQTQQTPVSGTPAGNYTITVTAAAGSDTKSATITLTVP